MSLPQVKTFIKLGDAREVTYLRVVHLKLVKGSVLSPHDSLQSFIEKFTPLNILCPDLFSDQPSSYESCPGSGAYHQYNSKELIPQDTSLH